MRTLALTSFLVLLVASSCADAGPNWVDVTPEEKQIQRLEAKLSQESCIGDLLEWERRYQFKTTINARSPDYGKTDQNLITFTLRRGSADYPIEPKRSVLSSYPSLSFEIDDRPGHSARGEFNLDADTITVLYCGYSEGG